MKWETLLNESWSAIIKRWSDGGHLGAGRLGENPERGVRISVEQRVMQRHTAKQIRNLVQR